VNQQLTTTVNQINGYSKQIADLNAQIANASGQGQPPNQLLDQRDQAVADLSKAVGVSVVQGANGYSVFLSSGQPLVVSNQSFDLGTKVSSGDPSELDVTYNGLAGTTPATTQYLSSSVLSGGTVGGLLTFRSQTLDPAQAQLGAVATSFVNQVNSQNTLGLDLSANVGGNLFSVAAPTVYSNLQNTGTSTLSVAFANGSQPTAGDYTLSYNGTTYTLTDNASGSTIGTITTLGAGSVTIGGLALTLSGTMNSGDSFTIQPTRGALNSFALATSNTSAIAAASPVLVSTSTTNTGTGTVTQGTVSAGYTLPATPLTLTYNSATNTLDGWPVGASVSVNGAAATTGTSFPYAAGNTYTYNGMTFTMSGAPANGDTLTIAKNTGTADGRNALAMSKLVSTTTLGNGTATLTGAYANYVNNVGNAATQLKSANTAQTALVSQITAAQQSVSGVNLDEEAANLLKYQQLYQANSKVIQSAESMFQTLMGIFG
jgi:flagellar hook-associated protein 1 FlgK